jgi:hypothetical protein
MRITVSTAPTSRADVAETNSMPTAALCIFDLAGDVEIASADQTRNDLRDEAIPAEHTALLGLGVHADVSGILLDQDRTAAGLLRRAVAQRDLEGALDRRDQHEQVETVPAQEHPKPVHLPNVRHVILPGVLPKSDADHPVGRRRTGLSDDASTEQRP